MSRKTGSDNFTPFEDGFIFFGNQKIPFHIDWDSKKNGRIFMQDIIDGACIPTPVFAEYGDGPILAYIVNIGMLGEGVVKGEWLPFPTTPEILKATLKSIGIDKGRYKRFMVAQYITDVGGLAALLPSLPCLNELNILAYLLKDMECEEMDVLEAALEFTGPSKLSEIINLVLNLSLFEYIPDVSDEEELGRYCVETFDFCDVPGIDEFLKYIDHRFYGINKSYDEDGAFVEGGYISALTDIPTIFSSFHDFPESIERFDFCPDCNNE